MTLIHTFMYNENEKLDAALQEVFKSTPKDKIKYIEYGDTYTHIHAWAITNKAMMLTYDYGMYNLFYDENFCYDLGDLINTKTKEVNKMENFKNTIERIEFVTNLKVNLVKDIEGVTLNNYGDLYYEPVGAILIHNNGTIQKHDKQGISQKVTPSKQQYIEYDKKIREILSFDLRENFEKELVVYGNAEVKLNIVKGYNEKDGFYYYHFKHDFEREEIKVNYREDKKEFVACIIPNELREWDNDKVASLLLSTPKNVKEVREYIQNVRNLFKIICSKKQENYYAKQLIGVEDEK